MGYQTPNQMISYREESSSDEEEAFQTRDKSNNGSYEPINMEKSSTEAVDKNDRTSLPGVRQ